MVETIFGVSWDGLRVLNITRFLADAGDEPLTWEAKADGRGRLSPRAVRQEICAFANSERGGYLILGTTGGRGEPWTLPGLRQPPPDLSAWISSAASGVSPTPRVDVRTFRATATRGRVAIVWIPPVDEPPAITIDGGIFVRIAGASPSVTDPRVLAELFGRGATGRLSAAERAEQAVNNATRSQHRFVSFGGAAIGGPREIHSPIYGAAFLKDLENIARERLSQAMPVARVEPAMDHRKAWIRLRDSDEQWRGELQAHRDGSVGVHFWSGPNTSFDPLAMVVDGGHVQVALGAIVAVLARSGASGRVNFRVSVQKALSSHSDKVDLERWIDLAEPTEADISGLIRDLRRGAQEFVVELP